MSKLFMNKFIVKDQHIPGDIISLSILPENMDTKGTYTKS